MTPWIVTHHASLSFTISQNLPKFMSVKSVIPSNHPILCHPLLLLPLVFPSIRIFYNESAVCIRWPKYWSFSISPSKEYSGLISFKINWFDLSVSKGPQESSQEHLLHLQIYQRAVKFLIWKHMQPD